MNSNYLPTKTNLIKLQESLRITKQGHELLERKRMILTKELEKYLKRHEEVKKNVQDIVESGKILIRNANIDLGIDNLASCSSNVSKSFFISSSRSPGYAANIYNGNSFAILEIHFHLENSDVAYISTDNGFLSSSS